MILLDHPLNLHLNLHSFVLIYLTFCMILNDLVTGSHLQDVAFTF